MFLFQNAEYKKHNAIGVKLKATPKNQGLRQPSDERVHFLIALVLCTRTIFVVLRSIAIDIFAIFSHSSLIIFTTANESATIHFLHWARQAKNI